MKLNLHFMMVLWALMLLTTAVVGFSNLDAFEELHRREDSIPAVSVPSVISSSLNETQKDASTTSVHKTVVVTPIEKMTETGEAIVVTTEDCETKESPTEPLPVPETTLKSVSFATQPKCPSGTGCLGFVSGVQPAGTGVTEILITQTITQTECPGSGGCTGKFTSVITFAAHPGTAGTGSLVLPIHTGGHYVNSTDKPLTLSKTTGIPEGSASKSPSGPTTTATHAPHFNGVNSVDYKQVIMSQFFALALVMVVLQNM